MQFPRQAAEVPEEGIWFCDFEHAFFLGFEHRGQGLVEFLGEEAQRALRHQSRSTRQTRADDVRAARSQANRRPALLRHPRQLGVPE